MDSGRRGFLQFSLSAIALGVSGLSLGKTQSTSNLLLSCRSDRAGRHFFTAIDIVGKIHFDIPLPARGHDAVIKPGGMQSVVFARRPGEFMFVIDLDSGQVIQKVSSSNDRHYYGHGDFDANGLLYVSENDYEAGRGVIGVYDSNDGYRRVGEFASHGVGPHELKFLADKRTVVIANGGIKTHPDYGRTKLNLKKMQPNLAYVDASSGQLLDAYQPPRQWHQLSIRHLDIIDDTVCAVMQYQGPVNQRPPLIALHSGEDHLRLLAAPDSVQKQMRNYCGSVCGGSSGKTFAVSSPRGNITTFWSKQSGDYLGSVEVTDGCGLAPGDVSGEFIISNGNGALYRCRNNKLEASPILSDGDIRWDNHLTASLFA